MKKDQLYRFEFSESQNAFNRNSYPCVNCGSDYQIIADHVKAKDISKFIQNIDSKFPERNLTFQEVQNEFIYFMSFDKYNIPESTYNEQ
jgi:hypothetical protein